jgi:MoaA/NifB/PqqE/SkfB family radical SAM enzyme
MESLNINLYLQYTKCNLNCPYCYVKDRSRDIDERGKRFLTRLSDAFKSIGFIIDVTIEQNGEILISDALKDFVRELTRAGNSRTIAFYSNLLIGEEDLRDFVQSTDPSRLALCCTYHPHVYKDYEAFKTNLTLLKSLGVATAVVMVAYPGLMNELPAYRKDFDSIGTPLNMLAFVGSYKGKTYPAAYTEDEKELLRGEFYSEDAFEYNLLRRNTRGLDCTSGVSSISIDHHGEVYACRKDWMKKDQSIRGILSRWLYRKSRRINPFYRGFHLGNVFSGFKLLERHECPHETCTCPREFNTTVDFLDKYQKTRNILIYHRKTTR